LSDIAGAANTPKEHLMSKITPCLWFDDNAEEAARFYVSVFKRSRLGTITRYGDAGAEVSGRPKGSVMTATFEIDGQEFVALYGGPTFTFNEAVSFQVHCHTQEEVDDYWNALSAGGDARAQQCGWLKDTACPGRSCRPCSSRCSRMGILEKPIAPCKLSFR
jgi:predicted 3-demethylubiquinone-9 3-methyltransferase (glyoxalase superfamily)